ncbi:hypothetical protein ACSLVK_16635 [Photorhabdus tasmaniensis]|uniref:hypothetical protein n=1 Tax=Photorhabdus tasmaniensis TaxID=1004159 RepID=UPI004042F4B0
MRMTKPLIKRSHHIILADDGDICYDVKKFQEAKMKQQFLDGNRKVNAWQSAPLLAAMSELFADQVVKIITGYDELALVGKKLYIA